MKYLFVLGRDVELSIAELKAYYSNFKILEQDHNLLLVETPEIKSIEQLGGTVKVAQVLTQALNLDEVEYVLDHTKLYLGTTSKPVYSVLDYRSEYGSFVISYLKQYFKEMKCKALYKKEITPSQLAKNRDRTVEIILYKQYVTKTILVSDPSKLELRDIKRPYTNFLETISLRLAKIMINLSGIKKGTLYDPFCGTGSILQEALLMGYDVIGSDIEINAVRGSLENLKWLEVEFQTKGKFKVLQFDAKNIKLPKNSVDLVVTEPYMGPYWKRLPTREEAEETVAQLKVLYDKVLEQLYNVLKLNGKVVIIVPKLRVYPNKEISFDFEKIFKKYHFTSTIEPLNYFSQKSKLRRQIFVLQKV